MNALFRSEAIARLNESKASLARLEVLLETGQTERALSEICELRTLLNALFADLLAAHISESPGATNTAELRALLLGLVE